MMFFSKKLILIITVIVLLGIGIFIWIGNVDGEEISIKILISGNVTPTLIELVDGNVLEITLINNFFTPYSDVTEYDELFTRENIFGYSTIDGFIIPKFYSPSRGEYMYSTIISNERLYLSRAQMNTLRRLIRNVTRRKPDREFEGLSFESNFIEYVWAIIDGEIYWSLYHPNIDESQREDLRYQYLNRDLLMLTYELIKISPVPVGGEWNPLETPRDFY